MSLDYPNREQWLAIRSQRNIKPLARWVHVSKVPQFVTMNGHLQATWPPGTTFDKRRNEQKRTGKRMDVISDRRLRQRGLAA